MNWQSSSAREESMHLSLSAVNTSQDMGLGEGGTQVTQQGHSDVYLGKLREGVIAALLIF